MINGWVSTWRAVSVAACVVVGGCASRHDGSADATSARVVAREDEIVHFSHETPGVPQPGQRVFGSPEEAVGVLQDAASAQDRQTLVSLFGTEGSQLIFAGDRVLEDADMRAFADHMREYAKVDRPSADTAVLRMGKANWPFPIPLVKSASAAAGSGGWFFDTVAGRDELLDRRIGEDELNAIAVCRAYVAAQKEYVKLDRNGDGVVEYAQHFRSGDGKHDGLFWEVKPGEPLSPMGPLVAAARMEGYPAATGPKGTGPHPYKGYVFHILKAQGDAAPGGRMSYVVDGKMTKGFAMVAYPSKYGAGGVMTFIVGQDGKVYQKDLGEQTAEVVGKMQEYDPDKTWQAVEE